MATTEQITGTIPTTIEYRSRKVLITAPKGSDIFLTATREGIFTDDGTGLFKINSYEVRRRLSEVKDETIEINGSTISVSLVAGALSAFIDKWDQEDKAKTEETPEQ